MAKCSVPDCENIPDRKGFCTRHYMRNLRNGSPTGGRRDRGLAQRYFDQFALPFSGEECLEWPFYKNARSGYAQAKLGGRLRLVHRYMCETVHGSPPSKGHQAAHKCGNRACVNSAHLSWKTPLENEADKATHGTKRWGIDLHNAKLSSDEVTAIKVLRGRLPAAQIAEIFKITKTTVSVIQLGKSRTHG